jgi:hypothetical protein
LFICSPWILDGWLREPAVRHGFFAILASASCAAGLPCWGDAWYCIAETKENGRMEAGDPASMRPFFG